MSVKWQRIQYMPLVPMGKDGRRITAGEDHLALARHAAAEGMVLLKNEGHLLPFQSGTRLAVFGKAQADYVKGGGGSGDVTTAYSRSLLEGLRIKEQEGKLYGMERDIAEKVTQLAEKEGQLAEKEGQLAEKEGQLAEKEGQLAEKNEQLAKKEGQLAEKNEQLAEREGQLRMLVKMLVQSGKTIDAIAESLNLDKESVKTLL